MSKKEVCWSRVNSWLFVPCWVQALERGVAFEVSYSAALRDSTLRRYTISNAMFLTDTCKGKVLLYI